MTFDVPEDGWKWLELSEHFRGKNILCGLIIIIFPENCHINRQHGLSWKIESTKTGEKTTNNHPQFLHTHTCSGRCSIFNSGKAKSSNDCGRDYTDYTDSCDIKGIEYHRIPTACANGITQIHPALSIWFAGYISPEPATRFDKSKGPRALRIFIICAIAHRIHVCYIW